MDAKSLKKKLKKMEAHKFENINLRSYNMVLQDSPEIIVNKEL